MDKYMVEALKEAKKAERIYEVPIGAVIVKDGEVIAKAHNMREKKQSSLAHAEVLCIEKACKKLNSWRLDNCELYVTLEPCLMCSGAITQARIKKVYFGALDEKNGTVMSISNVFDDINTTHKVEYEFLPNDECSKILSSFFKKIRKNK
ncbi:MAG: nucleoside deaminase [Clostridia bacterium]|nr:nucleoside deaminase [Clostridia bacterium]